MKKIVRLTESDLMRIVNSVINETINLNKKKFITDYLKNNFDKSLKVDFNKSVLRLPDPNGTFYTSVYQVNIPYFWDVFDEYVDIYEKDIPTEIFLGNKKIEKFKSE